MENKKVNYKLLKESAKLLKGEPCWKGAKLSLKNTKDAPSREYGVPVVCVTGKVKGLKKVYGKKEPIFEFVANAETGEILYRREEQYPEDERRFTQKQDEALDLMVKFHRQVCKILIGCGFRI